MSWLKVTDDTGTYYKIQTTEFGRKWISQGEDNEEVAEKDADFLYGSGGRVIEYVKKTDLHDCVSLPSGLYQVKQSDDGRGFLREFVIKHDKTLFKLEIIQEILDDFNLFKESKHHYERFGNIYKRGCLIFGPPGTGKTTAINVILKDFLPKDCLVIVANTNIPSKILKELKYDSRLKIFVFEELTDIVSSSHELADLLTFLDGEETLDSMYVLATTNYPEKLPKSLTNRPGRFDRLFQIDELSLNDKIVYSKHYLERELYNTELEMLQQINIASLKELFLIMIKENLDLVQAYKKINEHREMVKQYFNKKLIKNDELNNWVL